MVIRKLEKFYTHSAYVAEFWNTVSNLPFIMVGLYRLYQGSDLTTLYTLYALAGVCSGFHHAHPARWTVLIDWVPIVTSIFVGYSTGILSTTSNTTDFWIYVAVLTLLTDHLLTPLPVPWGHVLWHLLAAYSIDRAYQDYEAVCYNISVLERW